MARAARTSATQMRAAALPVFRPLVPSSFLMFGSRRRGLSSLGELAFGLAFWGGVVWLALAHLGLA